MSTSKQKSVSYRRNRDYSKQFDWTYELNEDLHKCYTEAREVPKKGYMARMKKNVGRTSPGTKPFNRKIFETTSYIYRETSISFTNC